jgi:hypothetical protein
MTCNEIYLPDVRSWIQLHPDAFIEAYPTRRVNNLYLDTHEVDCLNDHLDGADERSKLRFRWYGEDLSAVRGVLELKRRINRLGWKEQCPIPVTFDLRTISWDDWMGQMQGFADGIWSVWLSRRSRPTLINSYMREYYESVDRQIRVTIDYDQIVYGQITHSMPNLRFRAPIESQVVIEVKSDPALHRRVSNTLSLLPLQVERNSKYINGLIDSLSFTV